MGATCARAALRTLNFEPGSTEAAAAMFRQRGAGRSKTLVAQPQSDETSRPRMRSRCITMNPHAEAFPWWWRLFLIAAGTLILCSCRAPAPAFPPVAAAGAMGDAGTIAAAPPNNGPEVPGAVVPAAHWSAAAAGATAGAPPYPAAAYPPPAQAWPPYPAQVLEGFSPPGIAGPWPRDEYLFDGGDGGLRAAIARQVHRDPQTGAPFVIYHPQGLEAEDTIVHFDTLDGQTRVAASNRLPIYAPRFASVRSVRSAQQNQQDLAVQHMYAQTRLARHEESQRANTALQRYQSESQVGMKQLETYRQRLQDGAVSSRVDVLGFHTGFLPYEDLAIIRRGHFDQAEKARLAAGMQAAASWSHDLTVVVMVGAQAPKEEVGDRRAQATFSYDVPEGQARVRVIKVASRQAALPGETVDFTIRFDNVGDQVVGNVTVIDSLTTRLEYVPDSAQCSLGHDFRTQPNEQDSLQLIWELREPLQPGDGGVVRFRARVR
jgi:uncharacterized repeat protein (TIGR01451 family)